MQASIAVLAVLLALCAGGRAEAMIVWGDIHAHSGLSNDGAGDPREFFRSARDFFRLDFVVLSDHDIHLTPEEVETLNRAAAEFDEPGRFVAFPGVEWTHDWHMNFYFRDPDSPICGGGGGPPCDGFDDARSFYAARVLAGEAAAHVNHPVPLNPVHWWKMRDDVTTNVEVYNTHWNRNHGADSSEFFFGGSLWALRVGFRLGFVAASDDHSPYDFVNVLGTGLTACDVEELTRTAILDALRRRRCYASTGRRVLLDFHVGGTGMGGEVEAPIGSTVTAEVAVTAPTVPTRLELLVNGAAIAQKTDCASNVCSLTAPIAVAEEYNFAYAKVYEGPPDRTWSSPVWIRGTCTAPEDCPADRFVPGMGAPASRCIASWRVLPATDQNSLGSPRRRVTCTAGDPKCDFDPNTSACTFRVGICSGIDPSGGPCASDIPERLRVSTIGFDDESLADIRNEQTLTASARALLSADPAGRCGPYVDITLPLSQSSGGSPRRDARTFVLRSQSGDRRDRDRLTLLCLPPALGP